METKTIIYLVAAALVLRVVIRTIIRFLREGSESTDDLAADQSKKEETFSEQSAPPVNLPDPTGNRDGNTNEEE